MLKIVISLIGMFVFLGCASVEFIPSKPQESYIQATRKTELIAKEQTQIVIIATHLNAYDTKKYPNTKGEFFLLDIYQANGDKKAFLENGYMLTLNGGAKPLKIEKITKESLESLQDINLENLSKWGTYYLVEFAPQSVRVRNSLRLIIAHKDFGENYLYYGFKPLDKDDLREKH